MTISRSEILNSYWSSTEMKPTTSLTSLLTRDLEARSAGSSGRLLLERLEFYCFDLRGELRALEFAQAFSRTKKTPAIYSSSSWSGPAAQPDFQLVALVALAPDLDRIAGRLGRGVPVTTPWRKSWPKPLRRFAGPRSSPKESVETSSCAMRDLEPEASSDGWPGTTSRRLPSLKTSIAPPKVATASCRSSWTDPLSVMSSHHASASSSRKLGAGLSAFGRTRRARA